MAYITKRGSSYSVRYTYQDEHGKSCDKWESFPTKEEGMHTTLGSLRSFQSSWPYPTSIEYTFTPPF